MVRIVKSKYLFDGNAILLDKAIVLQDNIIIDVIAIKAIDSLYGTTNDVIDYGEGLITQGFTDLQINGIGGVAFNGARDEDTLEIMYQTNLKFGSTWFLPTMISCDFREVIEALEAVKKWFFKYGDKRGVLGIHLEGPFLSKIKSGIHSPQYIIKPTIEYLEKIVSYGQYFPIKLTIAVEEFTPEQIEYLVKNKIVLAIGHSNASYNEVSNSYALGVGAVTHIFNAMSGLTARNPGVIGAALNLPFYCGLIADLVHVESSNIELLYKLKKDLIYLVSDSVTPTGTDITEFNFADHILHVKDNKIIDANGVLGGADLTLNQAIKNCIKIGIPLFDALKMAVITPLRVMELDTLRGCIAKGSTANLVYLDLMTFDCKVI